MKPAWADVYLAAREGEPRPVPVESFMGDHCIDVNYNYDVIYSRPMPVMPLWIKGAYCFDPARPACCGKRRGNKDCVEAGCITLGWQAPKAGETKEAPGG